MAKVLCLIAVVCLTLPAGTSQAADLLVCDFNGTEPSLHTPWTKTSFLDPNISFGGWRRGTGVFGTAGANNVFAFYVSSGGTESTLAEAITDSEYVYFTIGPAAGTLNLASKKVNFTVRRIDWHAPRQYAVFSSVTGFTDGNQIFTTQYLDSGNSSPVDFNFILPTAGYNNITSPVEFRIYGYKANWSGHDTSLTAFSITEPTGLYTLTLTSTPGGTATTIPEGTIFDANTAVQLVAAPDPGFHFAGWSGDVAGFGNPRTTIMNSNKTVTANFVPNTTAMSIGMNLGGVVDWSTDWVFVDAFKMSREWLTRSVGGAEWDSGKRAEIPADANGWPTVIPFTAPSDGKQHFVHTMMPAFVAGDYTVILQGAGQIQFWNAASATFNPPGGTSTYALNVAPGKEGTLFINIFQSSASDPIRNIRIVMPGFAAVFQNQPFHPLFLERLQQFTNLRFMDWGTTNASPLVSWSQRTTPDTYTQTRSYGVALEYMAQLANTLGEDAWVCIPHQADDDYITQAARLLRDSVNPNLKICVEYSNETWNTIFAQTTYVQDRGEALGLAPGDRWRAGQLFCALRSRQIWEIFEDEIADANRLVKVMATQSANVNITDTRFDGLNSPTINPSYTMPDALAVAPYFGKVYTPADVPPYPTVDDILLTIAPAEINSVQAHTVLQKQVADEQGCRLVCYEGGQHFVGAVGAENDQALTDTLIAANRDSRMFNRYMEYLNMLKANGVDMFGNFSFVSSPSKWGSWGVLEYMNQPIENAPKYRALVNWLNARSRGDFNLDGYVNLPDLKLFCQQWLTNPADDDPNSADLDDSNNVDFYDFALMGTNWMR